MSEMFSHPITKCFGKSDRDYVAVSIIGDQGCWLSKHINCEGYRSSYSKNKIRFSNPCITIVSCILYVPKQTYSVTVEWITFLPGPDQIMHTSDDI